MLRLRCIERKEKGKTRGVGGPERDTAHFRSSVATEKFMSQQGFSRPVLRQGLPCRDRDLRVTKLFTGMLGGWVATKAFSIATEICQPCAKTKIQCRDRVWGWDKVFGSRQWSPCVATEISQG